MPYDPSLPLPNSPLESQVIRDQLQSLFVLINNIASISAAQVDVVNTLPPGSSAQVGVNFDGSNVRFTFGIPQGYDGATGPTGQPGEATCTLGFAPTPGTNLTVIKNTGLPFISGQFSNLANEATVNLTHDGTTYPCVAWYYGGEGNNDLVSGEQLDHAGD